jgi:small subunit ribosomal protein S18
MAGAKLVNKPKKKDSFKDKAGAGKTPGRRHVLSLSQLLGRIRKQREAKLQQQKRQIKPIIPPKSLVILLKEKPEKTVYNRRIIDYKHCGLLQRYTGLGGKILPRRQTRLSAKQQRYIAKTIKSARIMGLLPFVRKEKGFFR